MHPREGAEIAKAVRALVKSVQTEGGQAQNEALVVLLEAVMGALEKPVKEALARVMLEVREALREAPKPPRSRARARDSPAPRAKIRPKVKSPFPPDVPKDWIAPVTSLFPKASPDGH